MAAILDTPMATIGLQNLLSVGVFRGTTGDPIGEFWDGGVAGFFVEPLPFDDKCLTDMGKVQVGVEFGGGPDFPRFNPAMIRRVNGHILGFLTIGKKHLQIVKEYRLIAFGREMIVSLPGADQVFSEPTLGQERVGGDCFVLNINSIQERDGRSDLVRALCFVITSRGQSSYFFWV
jgi:hypothetical protein